MKTRIIQPTEQKPETPIKYPCLMKGADGDIALATDDSSGVLVHSTPTMEGVHAVIGGSTWVSEGYTHMRGKVVIEFDMEDGQ